MNGIRDSDASAHHREAKTHRGAGGRGRFRVRVRGVQSFKFWPGRLLMSPFGHSEDSLPGGLGWCNLNPEPLGPHASRIERSRVSAAGPQPDRCGRPAPRRSEPATEPARGNEPARAE